MFFASAFYHHFPLELRIEVITIENMSFKCSLLLLIIVFSTNKETIRDEEEVWRERDKERQK